MHNLKLKIREQSR